MNLHHDTQLFSQTLRAASQHLEINLGFVEKDQDPILSVSSKIRHFYDLYFLAKDDDCIQSIESDIFKQQFLTLFELDKKMFDEPMGWANRSISESPLIRNFDSLWSKLKEQYQSELYALAYRPIPDEKEVAQTFIRLSQRIV
ncbi:hypothetical protein [Petrimonas sp.]|jgi:hypothetical protein|uniref:hypothetical protein n=1 Tax=Petrimonas sp. TaxID=2023866 RepID=UPI002FC61661